MCLQNQASPKLIIAFASRRTTYATLYPDQSCPEEPPPTPTTTIRKLGAAALATDKGKEPQAATDKARDRQAATDMGKDHQTTTATDKVRRDRQTIAPTDQGKNRQVLEDPRWDIPWIDIWTLARGTRPGIGRQRPSTGMTRTHDSKTTACNHKHSNESRLQFLVLIQ
ncbi:hypothetical protein TrVGV298_000124 [Trichoderma virens]|nr:hypothetical protein TrVGV298_000124 [Trichoderma virens]